MHWEPENRTTIACTGVLPRLPLKRNNAPLDKSESNTSRVLLLQQLDSRWSARDEA
jgi:hypothetical protein